jgi:tetratricopeptide (TPR) repeat protein
VKRFSRKLWTVPLALLLFGGGIDVGRPLYSPALAQQADTSNNPSTNRSWVGSISSGMKSGFNKVGNALNPKRAPPATSEDKAVSLASEAKPSPTLYVAIGRLYSQSGKLAEAEQQYQLALKEKSDFLPALLAYAELKERMGQPNGAIECYQKAATAYPQDPSVYNNMGLFYARQGRLDEAERAIARAVRIAPKNVRYRNNIATVLIDQGNVPEAFGHLRQVHDEAAACYNLAFLLNKKGQTQAAIQHFTLALRADPSMVAAERWLDYLQKRTTQARLPQHPSAGGLRITTEKIEPDGPRNTAARFPDSPPVEPPEQPLSPAPTTPTAGSQRSLPEAPMPQMPQRLPPVSPRERESEGPTLPGISYDRNERPSDPVAPLPPNADTAVRHLPRVN